LGKLEKNVFALGKKKKKSLLNSLGRKRIMAFVSKTFQGTLSANHWGVSQEEQVQWTNQAATKLGNLPRAAWEDRLWVCAGTWYVRQSGWKNGAGVPQLSGSGG